MRERTRAGTGPGPPERGYVEATDADLMAWAGRGDRRAFDQIVGRYAAYTLRVAARLLGDAGEAEDIAQEALSRAWESAPRFDPRRGRFTTWLYRIVANLCTDHFRRPRDAALPADFDAADPADGAYEVLEGEQLECGLSRALAELPVRQRAAIMLVYEENLSATDAAHALGTTVKAVERLLARAREHLRERMRVSDCSVECTSSGECPDDS